MDPSSIKAIVAMHKSYAVPGDPLYYPLHVGAAGKAAGSVIDTSSIRPEGNTYIADEIPGDDTGDNISLKNPMYSELTGLYWAWKNLTDAEAIGLVHYRRHFTIKPPLYIKKHGVMDSLLTQTQAAEILSDADIIVPTRRRYYIESLYSHYSHTLEAGHLDLARAVIARKYPEYLPWLDHVYSQKSGHMFNMCILKRPDLDEYCSFIFDVLFDMERRLKDSGYLEMVSGFNLRLFGRVSEIVFNAWLESKKFDGSVVREVNHVSTEPVNWLKKGSAFLAAKFLHKKYDSSF